MLDRVTGQHVVLRALLEERHGQSVVTQWQQLGRCLRFLKHLVKLQVKSPTLLQEYRQPAYLAAEAASLTIADALAGLPALRSVSLYPLRFSAEACVALAAASALTRLELQGADLRDFGVVSLAMGMPDLQVLDITHSSDVTDAVMPVIANHLPGLRELRLTHTGVSGLSFACLTKLQRLQRVEVCARDEPRAEVVLGAGAPAVVAYRCHTGSRD